MEPTVFQEVFREVKTWWNNSYSPFEKVFQEVFNKFLKVKKALEMSVDIAMYVLRNKHVGFIQLITKQNIV